METIAALLTVHNRREKTIACLDNLFKQDLPPGVDLKVYLTDDGCTDGTREEVTERFPQVTIIDGDGSLFWNRGMVVAWKKAAMSTPDYYLWLNDDTFIYSNTIKHLLESSSMHENKSVIVGTTCAVGNPEVITYGGWIDGKIISNVNTEQKCDTLNGNIVLVPRAVYEILGTNDPYYRHAVGDTDYGLRANEHGLEVWTVRGIMGECDVHEHPTVWMDPSQPLKKRWRNFFSPTGNNPFEFFHFRKKHYGLLPACITFVSNFVHFLFPWFWKESYKDYSEN